MLTSAQAATLRTYIDATPALAAQPANSDGAFAIALVLNVTASPDYWVWRTTITVDEVSDNITWANLTPNDTPDGTATWTNRSLQCQGKQFNLQMLLQKASGLIACGRSNVRQGFNDALTQIPSGNGGANRSAGWTAVETAMKRKATLGEQVLIASGNGAVNTPSALGFDGDLSVADVLQARA